MFILVSLCGCFYNLNNNSSIAGPVELVEKDALPRPQRHPGIIDGYCEVRAYDAGFDVGCRVIVDSVVQITSM